MAVTNLVNVLQEVWEHHIIPLGHLDIITAER